MRHLAALLLAAASPAVAQVAQTPPGGVVPSERANSAPRDVRFADAVPATGPAIVFAANLAALPAAAAALPAAERAALEAAARTAAFDGKPGAPLSTHAAGRRLLLVGTGSATPSASDLADAGGRAAGALRDERGPVTLLAGGADAAQLALGFQMGDYRFDRYKSDVERAPRGALTVVTADANARATFARDGGALLAGIALSRDLSAEPANVIYPESFVARTREAFRGVPNVSFEVLTEADMRRLGMGSIFGVGQGSARPPRLLIVRYTGAGSAAPLALVGKGITFDSGGISLKPGLGMWEMKADMSGAASAVGAVLAAAKRGARANVIAVAALAENMPDANAQRPGDVVRTLDGRTVEIINTDAEGRLVLVDANQYVARQYRPAALVNIATLTGAVVNALDDEYAGLFARDEALATRIQTAATASGEPVWRLPLHPNYAQDMRSDIADIKHAAEGRRPGAGLAAHFIQYLTPTTVPWAHLDIAGVNWADSATPTAPKGATGWGVRLFDQLIRGYEAGGR